MLCKIRDSRGDRRGEVKSFSKLFVLEFDSTRKRMSVVVRYPCGRVFLVTKVGEVEVGDLCRARRPACSHSVSKERWPPPTGISTAMHWSASAPWPWQGGGWRRCPAPREMAEGEVEEFRRSVAAAQQALEGREAAIQ